MAPSIPSDTIHSNLETIELFKGFTRFSSGSIESKFVCLKEIVRIELNIVGCRELSNTLQLTLGKGHQVMKIAHSNKRFGSYKYTLIAYSIALLIEHTMGQQVVERRMDVLEVWL